MRIQVPDFMGVFLVLLSCFVLTLSKASLWSKYNLCTDQYYSYCKHLPSYKCYSPYSTKLCCNTCEEYMLKYSAELENPKCIYGDKMANCSTLPRDRCYDNFHRLKCCYTCARSYTNSKDCEYGDWDKAMCQTIKPYHCYQKKVRDKCCQTCRSYDTGRPSCRYGDQRYYTVMKSRPTHLYNCRAFIGYFGSFRCKWSRYRTFQKKCCGSCHDAEIKLYRRYYG